MLRAIPPNVQYKYDADGIRVAQTVGGEETCFLIDGNQSYALVLEEYTPGGVIKVSYVYGLDLISQNRGGAKSFYHVDGLGSTRAMSDAIGLVIDRYVYDAFGRTIAQSGITSNLYLFAGEQRDGNLGLDCLRNRYLNVNTGQFTTSDAFPANRQTPLTLNRYVYCSANPVNYVDPSGQADLPQAMTYVAGIIVLGSIGVSYIGAGRLGQAILEGEFDAARFGISFSLGAFGVSGGGSADLLFKFDEGAWYLAQNVSVSFDPVGIATWKKPERASWNVRVSAGFVTNLQQELTWWGRPVGTWSLRSLRGLRILAIGGMSGQHCHKVSGCYQHGETNVLDGRPTGS